MVDSNTSSGGSYTGINVTIDSNMTGISGEGEEHEGITHYNTYIQNNQLKQRTVRAITITLITQYSTCMDDTQTLYKKGQEILVHNRPNHRYM